MSLVWDALLVGQETEAWSDDETTGRGEVNTGLTENRSCREVIYTIRREAGVGWEVGPTHQPCSL